METDEIKRQLQDIVCGNVLEGERTACTAARNFLCSRFGAGRTVKAAFEGRAIIKKEQAQLLRKYAQEHQLWLNKLPSEWLYLAKGGESTVYYASDRKQVFKVNDAVYYATWGEYFDSLKLHNAFF